MVATSRVVQRNLERAFVEVAVIVIGANPTAVT
jgi:hypothetical protein